MWFITHRIWVTHTHLHAWTLEGATAVFNRGDEMACVDSVSESTLFDRLCVCVFLDHRLTHFIVFMFPFNFLRFYHEQILFVRYRDYSTFSILTTKGKIAMRIKNIASITCIYDLCVGYRLCMYIVDVAAASGTC